MWQQTNQKKGRKEDVYVNTTRAHTKIHALCSLIFVIYPLAYINSNIDFFNNIIMVNILK